VTTESPFAPDLAPEFILETLGLAEAIRRLDDARGAREPFLVITGEPGTGKTVLANLAIARWGARVTAAHLVLPLRTGDELLEEILRRLGGETPEGANRPKLIARFEAVLGEIAARGQFALIVVDDAHHVPAELLEELRLLVGAARQARAPVEVMLLGPPALEARLDDPSLAALRQRVSVRVKLEPLSAGETRRYIRHRLAIAGEDGSKVFSRKCCAEIAAHTAGVPRQINALAAEALRRARASRSAAVEPSHLRDAVAALTGVLPKGEVEDAGEEPAEAMPAPPPPPPAARKPAPAPPPPPPTAQKPAPSPPPPPPTAQKPAPAPPPASTPKPVEPEPARSKSAAPAPARAASPTAPAEPVSQAPRVRDSSPDDEEFSKPMPAPPANYTPSEWVARFVGDKGPLQISAMVWPRESRSGEPAVAEESVVADEATSAESAQAPPRSRKAPRAPARPARRRHVRLGLPVTAGLGAIVVIGVIALMFRVIGIARDHARKTSDSTATASVTPPSDEKASSRNAAPGKQAGRSSEEPAGGAAPAIPRGPYTLETGALLDYQAALEDRSRIVTLTGIEGWVAPGSGEHSDQYRVVFGKFTSYSRAQSAAAMLMRSKTLPRVTVVKLPPGRVRQ
jgi:type II secretory pathway predicted ATPase ExeA